MRAIRRTVVRRSGMRRRDTRFAARSDSIVVAGMTRAVDAHAIRAPVRPLSVAASKQIASLLACPGEIRFAHAAIARDQPCSDAVRQLVRKTLRDFLVPDGFNAAVRRVRKARRPVRNRGASGHGNRDHERQRCAERPSHPRSLPAPHRLDHLLRGSAPLTSTSVRGKSITSSSATPRTSMPISSAGRSWRPQASKMWKSP